VVETDDVELPLSAQSREDIASAFVQVQVDDGNVGLNAIGMRQRGCVSQGGSDVEANSAQMVDETTAELIVANDNHDSGYAFSRRVDGHRLDNRYRILFGHLASIGPGRRQLEPSRVGRS